ncbi:MAG TPA: hypothetical protein VGN07_03100 [Steroidobacteraceae bacterium]
MAENRRPENISRRNLFRGGCISTPSTTSQDVALKKSGDSAMTTFQSFAQTTQRAVCLALAALIVTSYLSVGAAGAQFAVNHAYATSVASK